MFKIQFTEIILLLNYRMPEFKATGNLKILIFSRKLNEVAIVNSVIDQTTVIVPICT